MAIAITLKDFLDSAGVDYDLVSHPYTASSMYTATKAHVSGENLAKAVVLKDDHGYLVAVVPSPGLLGFAQDRFDSYSRVLEVGTGLALKRRESFEIKDVVRHPVV